METLKLKELTTYLPFDVQFINRSIATYGGISDAYQDKRGEVAYVKQRIGTVQGLKNGAILTTIGFFQMTMNEELRKGAHVTNNYEYKLLLRDVGDIRKEIEHKGDIFNPYERLVNFATNYGFHKQTFIQQFDEIVEYETWHLLPQFLFDKLCEWHFDLWGLLSRKLAVDVNTIHTWRFETIGAPIPLSVLNKNYTKKKK